MDNNNKHFMRVPETYTLGELRRVVAVTSTIPPLLSYAWGFLSTNDSIILKKNDHTNKIEFTSAFVFIYWKAIYRGPYFLFWIICQVTIVFKTEPTW